MSTENAPAVGSGFVWHSHTHGSRTDDPQGGSCEQVQQRLTVGAGEIGDEDEGGAEVGNGSEKSRLASRSVSFPMA
jgi:hypothetical protein